MKHRITRGLVLGVAVLSWKMSGHASEQMRSADGLESGKLAVAVYGLHVKNEDLQFRLRGADLIQVPLKGGGTAQFFADGNTDLRFQGKSEAALVRFTWRPATGFYYTFKAGVGDYRLEIPSGTAVNVLENGSQGRLWGVDAGWTLVSDTPVNPAVALSLGYARSDYNLERLQSGSSAPVAVNQRFTLEEEQIALSVSHRWKRLEPYGGLKIFRQAGSLYDKNAADRVQGRRDGWSPYAGLRIEFFPREALVLEAFGADERGAALGVSLGF